MPTITATAFEPSKRRIQFLFGLPTLLFLVFIWHRNYNLLGAFYDYSILTSATGHLHAGLHPYRDFTTPLQSLTVYLCSAAEFVFGQRYLALAYANLIAGLFGGYLVLRLLDASLSFPLRLLIATTFCVSTFFQHGILWYDSVAMLLLVLTCLQAAKLVHAPQIRRPDTLKLCLLLFLSSINKINFHLLGLAMVCLAFAAHCILHPAKTKSALLNLALVIVAAIIPGPVCEILINHTTPREFIENVILLPSGRSSALLRLADPNLYLGKLWDYYPDNWISGIFLLGGLIYVGCFYVVLQPSLQSGDATAPVGLFTKACAWIVFPVFYLASLLLTATNLETEIVTSVFLIFGLVIALTVMANHISPPQQLVVRSAMTVLAAFFLVAGSASAFMHSRIRYWDTSWTSSVLEAVRSKNRISAIKNAVPFYEAKAISPALEPYFSGVRFTEPARDQLAAVAALISHLEETTNAPDIYWGPGLEILGRVYGTQFRGRLPLWYHKGVSVREQDSPRIARELEQARYEWIVAAPLTNEIPIRLRNYLERSYDCEENDEILVYHRAH